MVEGSGITIHAVAGPCSFKCHWRNTGGIDHSISRWCEEGFCYSFSTDDYRYARGCAGGKGIVRLCGGSSATGGVQHNYPPTLSLCAKSKDCLSSWSSLLGLVSFIFNCDQSRSNSNIWLELGLNVLLMCIHGWSMEQKNVADLVEAGVLKVARPKASVTGVVKKKQEVCILLFTTHIFTLTLVTLLLFSHIS
jgi:hypothetical protein